MSTVFVSVSNKNGTLLIPRVPVTLFQSQQTAEWHGTLTLSVGQHLFAENYYELLTDSGESFEIFVLSVSSPDSGGFCAVEFRVSDSGRL